jgi:hypothetical protein
MRLDGVEVKVSLDGDQTAASGATAVTASVIA